MTFLDHVTCEKWIMDMTFRAKVELKCFPKLKFHQKVMLTVWWSRAGLIHCGLLSSSETITAKGYCKETDQMQPMCKVTDAMKIECTRL